MWGSLTVLLLEVVEHTVTSEYHGLVGIVACFFMPLEDPGFHMVRMLVVADTVRQAMLCEPCDPHFVPPWACVVTVSCRCGVRLGTHHLVVCRPSSCKEVRAVQCT